MAAVDLPANYSAETYQPLIQIRKYIHFGVQYITNTPQFSNFKSSIIFLEFSFTALKVRSLTCKRWAPKVSSDIAEQITSGVQSTRCI